MFLDVSRYPGVVQSLFSRYAFSWVALEHFGNEQFGLVGYGAPFLGVESVDATAHRFHDLIVVVAIKRRCPGEQNEEYNAAGPDIAFFVVSALEHFGGDIVGLGIRGASTVPSFWFIFCPGSKVLLVPKSTILSRAFDLADS